MQASSSSTGEISFAPIIRRNSTALRATRSSLADMVQVPGCACLFMLVRDDGRVQSSASPVRSRSQITGTSDTAQAAATYHAGASGLPVRATSQLATNGEKPPKNDALTT